MRNRRCPLAWLMVLGGLASHAPVALAQAKDKSNGIHVLNTASGATVGVLGPKPAQPAPTLFVFATTIRDTLAPPAYNKVGHLLAKQGVLSVAFDLPCHGQNINAIDAAGLNGWAKRLGMLDDDLVAGFNKQASAALDHLIKEGYTDPERVAVCGTSRGGFLALHWASAEPRVRCVAAFAPVADLAVLSEFKGLEAKDRVKAAALHLQATKLAGRPIWTCIGNNDTRVSTDKLIAFTRQVVEASVSQKKAAAIELHVMTSPGHTIHATAHDEAAAWIFPHLKAK